ncbi:tape measure protein [Buttiauxella noackiae]|uniref:tape measure protein n=1 Tax=Buttiauxella noackiae TaxID=82992 RepID=UPI0028D55A77|nr:tape measure protein [Buttiauxella noackiae]
MPSNQNAGSIVYEVDMDLDRFLRGQRQLSDSLNGMNRSFDVSTRSINNAERSASSAERSFSSLSRVAAALTAALSVQQVAQYADAWVTVNNKLANAIRPSEQLADVTQRVFDISQQTRSSLEATATLYARLERATRSAGTSTADLVKLTETINKGLAVSGATAAEASSTMVQLSQALASGVLRGQEFNSISENGSRLAIGLADSLGVTVGQLRDMAAQGQLTTEVVVKGLLSQGDAIAKEFANTAMTMGQAFSVATNNVTKFVGESSTIKSAYNGFNNTIVTLSQNLDTLSTLFIVLGGVMGSRFAGALAMATAAQVKNAIASTASAKAAELEAGAKLRLAQADKSAAISALNVAQTRLNTLKVTSAASVEEVKLASAEAATIRTQIAQIESEKALETVRLKAQITDQGRIATATRMAQLQQASAVLTTRLAATESAASQARSVAIVTAEAEVSAARMAAATATGAATAANGRYILSQEASAVASRAASGALASIGGPAGVAMLAAAAVYYFWQKSEQAKKESIEFADSLDAVISKMKEMNAIQLKGNLDKATDSIENQKESLVELRANLEKSRDKASELQRQFDGLEGSEAPTYVIADAQKRLTAALHEVSDQAAKVDTASQKLTRTQQQQAAMQAELNQKVTESEKAFNTLADQLAVKIPNASKAAIAALASTIQLMDELNDKVAEGSSASPPIDLSKYENFIEGQKQSLALLKLEGVERAKLKAVQDATKSGALKTDKDGNVVPEMKAQQAQIEANATSEYNLQKAEEARNKATKDSTAEGKKAETQAARNAKVLEEYHQKAQLSADSTSDLSRKQTILAATQKLVNPTPQMVAQVERDAAAAWDKAAALKAQSAVPELKENANYNSQKSALESLKGQTDANGKLLLSQEQYSQESERIEQEHQANIAKIKAGQAVTPIQEAQGSVDPVQQLANQHAQQLALIQQFETQKGVLTANGLALMNAANTQYEKARTDAQWEIYRNQSTVNELMASAIDGFSSQAASSLTGYINGTQTAAEATENLGNAILNSVIQSLVEVGIQYLKNAAMAMLADKMASGSSQQSAAATATAWAPAAAAASIATFGGAAVAGIAGMVAAFAIGAALAGKRKNGGPVTAGAMYEFGEGNLPEVFQSGGKNYMLPGNNGRVISNKDLSQGIPKASTGSQYLKSSGSSSERPASAQEGGSPTVIIHNYASSAQVQDYQMSKGPDGRDMLEFAIADINSGGPLSRAISTNHQAPRNARE